jgi:hypothetical protein
MSTRRLKSRASCFMYRHWSNRNHAVDTQESRSGSIQHYVIKLVKWLAAGWWFSPVSSTNKTGRHEISEILVTGTFCVHCSCKSNYHTITTTTSPTSKSLLTLHILQKIQLNMYNTCIQSDLFIICILQSVSTFTVYKGLGSLGCGGPKKMLQLHINKQNHRQLLVKFWLCIYSVVMFNWFSWGTIRVWRYQSGNRNPYIEEEQTTQWTKKKAQKDKQRSTKHKLKIEWH